MRLPLDRPELQYFLNDIVEAGSDVSLRLILADWLEEHDRPPEAELLRLHVGMLTTCCEPEAHPSACGSRHAWSNCSPPACDRVCRARRFRSLRART